MCLLWRFVHNFLSGSLEGSGKPLMVSEMGSQKRKVEAIADAKMQKPSCMRHQLKKFAYCISVYYKPAMVSNMQIMNTFGSIHACVGDDFGNLSPLGTDWNKQRSRRKWV